MLHKRLLKEYSTKNLKVYAVPQTEAIEATSVAFTGARHHLVDSHIPPEEIWVAEELMPTIEHKYFLFHEIHEYNIMSKGIPYETAHAWSNRAEGKLRAAKGKGLEEAIKREIAHNEDRIVERSHYNGTLALHQDTSKHHQHHFQHHKTEHNRHKSGIVSLK